MPVYMKKLPKQKKYRVYEGKHVSAKGTTKAKAEKQVKLLRGIAHGMKLKGSK